MIKNIIGEFAVVNCSEKKLSDLSDHAFLDHVAVYEVIKVKNRKPVFLEDHLTRFNNSCVNNGINDPLLIEKSECTIKTLIDKNAVEDCNLRLMLDLSEGTHALIAYYIPSFYPSQETYEKGVITGTYKHVRKNPNSKVYFSDYKQKVDAFIKNNNFYEALLVNDRDEITEGSKSNLFFILRNTVITAPDNQVLKGITRKHVLNVILNNGNAIQYRALKVNELNEVAAAFITGTSPGVLPVSEINGAKLNVHEPILQKIMQAFNRHYL